MKIYKTQHALESSLRAAWVSGRPVGFVPTMGALHEGHLSLIKKAREDGNLVVCSIFVNPMQFNNPDDLAKYPRTLEEDIEMLEGEKCDVLFIPSEAEIYPENHEMVKYDLGALESMLEGAFRPGHFQGVCQVVDRLLQMVRPQKMYIGQKDYQQCMVLAKLVEISKSPVELIIVPTMRESNGLAMSSRNRRLSEDARKKAPAIYEALSTVAARTNDPLPEVLEDALAMLLEKGFQVDYFEVADAKTLEVITEWINKPMVVLVAAIIDDVRLIDNLVI